VVVGFIFSGPLFDHLFAIGPLFVSTPFLAITSFAVEQIHSQQWKLLFFCFFLVFDIGIYLS